MMTCSESQKAFSPYLDGALSREAGAALAEHVGACPVCRHQLEETRALVRGLSLMARPAPASTENPVPKWVRKRRRQASPARRRGGALRGIPEGGFENAASNLVLLPPPDGRFPSEPQAARGPRRVATASFLKGSSRGRPAIRSRRLEAGDWRLVITPSSQGLTR